MADPLRQSILLPGDFPELFKFSRHTPPILLKQTMNTQAFNFFRKHANNFSIDFSSSSYLSPSIERFWGALLFVDISGFTALSTKMNVDDLRLHINTYFDKIISYADKYEGQTVKFAGDALYIIWQSPVNELPEDPYSDRSISKDVVQRAVACALEINQNLSDYKIVFVPSIGITTANATASTDSAAVADGSAITASSLSVEHGEETAFLNVHSGLSVGMMAGLDVGANDRWEFLLVGSPLGDVAAAEDSAKKGELIISERAHEVLHPHVKVESQPVAAHGEGQGEGEGDAVPLCQDVNTTLPCSCVLRKPGCYLVQKDLSVATPTHHEGRRTSLLDVNSAYAKRMCHFLSDTFVDAFAAWRDMILSTSKDLNLDSALTISDLRQELLKILKHDVQSLSVTVSPSAMIMNHFRTWAFQTISATLAAHVHQTARGGFDFNALRNLQTFSELLHSIHKHSFSSSSTPTAVCSLPVLVSPRPHGHGVGAPSMSSAALTATTAVTAAISTAHGSRRVKNSAQDMRLGTSISAPTHMETDLTAELRNVIVLFIKIDINFGDWQQNLSTQPAAAGGRERENSGVESPSLHHAIPHSPTRAGMSAMAGNATAGNASGSGSSASMHLPNVHSFVKDKDINPIQVPPFNFLSRSKSEVLVDYALLHKFQKCMDILTMIFMEKGGQLRQFIVDDKGTVCIGTFGLRGAVNYDDAAAAIEAAKTIIVQLRDSRMQAGIGITSGKAYCGLVGSPTRHEYAVMGPSVNLSARLMSKTSYLQILCDEEIKMRDRAHDFSDLGEITAKGYARPVRIYSPVLPELVRSSRSRHNHHGAVFGNANANAATSAVNLLAPQASAVRRERDTGLTIATTVIPAGPGNSNTATGNARDRAESKEKAINRRRVRNSFLTEHLRSSFNINSESSVSLYGRKNEIDALLRYLLKKVSSTAVSSSAGHLPRLDMNAAPLFVCIEGVCGIGKTVVLNEVCRVIARVNDTQAKVAVFRKRVSSYSSSEPFHAWRRIFRDMMAFLFKHETEQEKEKEREKERKKREKEEKERAEKEKQGENGSAGAGDAASEKVGETVRQESRRDKEKEKEKEIAPVEQVLQGVKLIELAMGEAGDIMSLLSSINFLPIESENASEIESLGPLSLLRSVDLLAKIVQTFILKTRHLIVVAFDDLQWIDFYSWLLIQKVWQEVPGAVVLTTYQTVSSAARVNKRNVSTSTFVNVQETFLDLSRTHIIELTPIDASAIELLVKEVLERNGFPTNNKEKLYSLINELSGGNPLYAYELIKVCVDQAQHNSSLLSIDPTFCSFVKDFKSNRVEEVIYFRFDQLDAASQTVLKVSSIVCIFGAPISVPMLEYLILEDGSEMDAVTAAAAVAMGRQGGAVGETKQETTPSYHEEAKASPGQQGDFNLLHVLRELLQHNEFLTVVVRERGDESFGGSGSGMEERKSVSRVFSHGSGGAHGAGERELPVEQLALLDDSLLREMQFEFSASIEQHAIYDLMLEEQKHYLHRKVANYYETSFLTRRGGRGNSNELFECGLHLEAAQLYHEAFPYFYRSASILHNLGSAQMSQQQLERAHKLLRQMKSNLPSTALSRSNSRRQSLIPPQPTLSLQIPNEAGEMDQTVGFSLKSCKSYKRQGTARYLDAAAILQDRQLTMHPSHHRKSLADITKALQSTDEDSSGLIQISLADAYKMFQGRVDLLETAIRVMLNIAQYKLFTFQEVNTSATYYEEALHLILVALSNHVDEDRQRQRRREVRDRERDRCPSNSYASELSSTQISLSEQSSEREQARHERAAELSHAAQFAVEDEEEERLMSRSVINGLLYYCDASFEHFYVQDFQLLFRALTGIIFLYRLGYIQDDRQSSKEAEAIKWYIQLSSPSLRIPEYYLEQVGLAFKRNLLFAKNQLEEEEEVVDQILATYRLEQCKDILQINFFDPVLPTVGTALQVAVLCKDSARVGVLLQYLLSTVRDVTHSSTMAMVMVSLCSSLVLLGRPDEANEIYTKVYLPLDEDAHVLNKFTDIKKPMGEWLRLVKHSGSNGVDLPGEGDVSYYFPNKILIRVICNPKTRHTLARIRPITHCCLDLMGLGKELINGAILFFHVMLTLKYNAGKKIGSKEEPLDKCLAMSKYYLDQSLNYTSARTESYFVCRAVSLLLKMRVVAMICKQSPDVVSPEETAREIDMCAQDLEKMIASKSCDLVLLKELLEKARSESNAMIDPDNSGFLFGED